MMMRFIKSKYILLKDMIYAKKKYFFIHLFIKKGEKYNREAYFIYV